MSESSEEMSTTEKIVSLATAIGQAIIHPSEAVASREEFDRRIAICNGCMHRSGRRCRVCTCSIFVKALVGTASCPKEKW